MAWIGDEHDEEAHDMKLIKSEIRMTWIVRWRTIEGKKGEKAVLSVIWACYFYELSGKIL